MQGTRRVLLGTAVSAALLIASGVLAGGAQAGAMAVSIFEVNNFRAVDTAGTQLLFGSQIGAISGNNSGDTSANLDSVNAPQNAALLVPIVPPSFGALDLPQACIGGGCPPFGENSYSGFGFAPPPGSTYALGDMVISGTTIDTTPAGVPNSGGADAHTRADALIASGAHIGSSQTNAGTDVNFTFTALANLDATFTLDYIVQLRAFLDIGPGETGSAQASVSWNLNLINLTTGLEILNCAPGVLNTSRTASVDGTNLFVDDANTVTCATFTLDAGNIYQLSVRHTSQADARLTVGQVPEPFTAGLLGAGLMALGWMRRRRG